MSLCAPLKLTVPRYYGLSLIWSVTQFNSQLLPPSFETDCSKCGELVVVAVHTKRVKTALPF